MSVRLRPPFPFFEGESVEGPRMRRDEGVVRPVALPALGQRYRRYRLPDPAAEAAMGDRNGAIVDEISHDRDLDDRYAA